MVVPDFRTLLEERIDMNSLESMGVIDFLPDLTTKTVFYKNEMRLALNVGAINWYNELINNALTKEAFLEKLDILIFDLIKKNGSLIAFVKVQTPEMCLEVLKNTKQNNNHCYNYVKIVKSKSLEDCIQKLESKLKLENMIMESYNG